MNMRRTFRSLAATVLALSLAAPPAAHASAYTQISNASGTTADITVYARNYKDSSTAPALSYAAFSLADNRTRQIYFFGLAGTWLSYLTGSVGQQTIVPMNCKGVENGDTSVSCTANSAFRVVKRSDGSYHFEKTQ